MQVIPQGLHCHQGLLHYLRQPLNHFRQLLCEILQPRHLPLNIGRRGQQPTQRSASARHAKRLRACVEAISWHLLRRKIIAARCSGGNEHQWILHLHHLSAHSAVAMAAMATVTTTTMMPTAAASRSHLTLWWQLVSPAPKLFLMPQITNESKPTVCMPFARCGPYTKCIFEYASIFAFKSA